MSKCIYTQEQFNKVLEERNELANENFKLKQHFAEKEKEIEKLQHCNDRLAQGIYHSYGEHFISKVKQDKISFALEQLEKIKEWIHEHRVIPFFEERYIIYVKSLNNEIDNQIEELKRR